MIPVKINVLTNVTLTHLKHDTYSCEIIIVLFCDVQ